MEKQMVIFKTNECYKTFEDSIISYDDIVDMFEEANEINPNSFDNVDEYIEFEEIKPFIYHQTKISKYNEEDTYYYVHEEVNNNGTSTYHIYDDYRDLEIEYNELYTTNEWDDVYQFIANTENVILYNPYSGYDNDYYYPQDNKDDNE